MPLSGHKAGSWHTITSLYYRLAGVWKTVGAGYVKVSGVWKQVYGTPLSVLVDDPNPFGSALPGATATTNLVTATPSGGVAPYAHSWAYVSGDAATAPVKLLSSATQQWRRGIPHSGPAVFLSVWRDTVTDNLGNTAQVDVNTDLESSI